MWDVEQTAEVADGEDDALLHERARVPPLPPSIHRP